MKEKPPNKQDHERDSTEDRINFKDGNLRY